MHIDFLHAFIIFVHSFDSTKHENTNKHAYEKLGLRMRFLNATIA
jgi:hypothetical protein